MTQEIIDMARQAGFVEKDAMFRSVYLANIKDLEAFAALAAAKERERIFDLLHEMHAKAKGQHNYYLHAVVPLKQKVKHDD